MKNMINPQELAKRTKETARTVSLRIKEKTWLGFEQLAKDNNTTANALISELADYYIETQTNNLNLSDSAVRLNKFKTFLEKETRKLCRWTIDDAVVDVNMAYAHTAIDGNKYNLSYLNKLKHIFRTMCLTKDGNELYDINFDFGTSLGDDTSINLTLKKEASYYTGAFDPAYPFQNILYIPIEKAPDIISLFMSINGYFKDNAITLKYDIDIMDKLVEIINNYDYKYEEEDSMHDGPIINYDKTARQNMLHEIKQAIIDHAEEEEI